MAEIVSLEENMTLNSSKEENISTSNFDQVLFEPKKYSEHLGVYTVPLKVTL